MLLTITTTHSPASELAYLLERRPARTHEFELPGGRALMFYPKVSAQRCTAALLLDQYVNDRPYVAPQLMSVAIGVAYESAMAGKCRYRPELAATPIPLEARLPVLPCRGGSELLRALFEPAGYVVETEQRPLDDRFPEWGLSPFHSLTLSAVTRLQDLLRHLHLLLPAIDEEHPAGLVDRTMRVA
jgi:hypothetical protein